MSAHFLDANPVFRNPHVHPSGILSLLGITETRRGEKRAMMRTDNTHGNGRCLLPFLPSPRLSSPAHLSKSMLGKEVLSEQHFAGSKLCWTGSAREVMSDYHSPHVPASTECCLPHLPERRS